MGAFFHAVAVFFHHLAEVKWRRSASRSPATSIKLLFRGRAWQQHRARGVSGQTGCSYRSAFGAYVAGVGVNSIVAGPRRRPREALSRQAPRARTATYATLAPTLVVETLFDFVVARGADRLGARRSGCCRRARLYSRIPTVDWKFFLRHSHGHRDRARSRCFAVAVIGFVWARRRARSFRGACPARASRSSPTAAASSSA